MTESVITEHSGTQRDRVSRIYRYDPSGVRVLDSRNVTQRLYRFDPSQGMMTEIDPAQPSKILRRFVFDAYGMLEETFSFGNPPRTFRYEAGGQRIVMREGGDYGAVGKTYSFEGNGISETAFGRNGEIERVWTFDRREETISIRTGGWYGNVERTLVCERIDVSVFLDPEAFLQFLMFTEKSARESDAEIEEQVAKIRGETGAGRGKYAYAEPRRNTDAEERNVPGRSGNSRPVYSASGRSSRQPDSGIDFIPDADSSSSQPAAVRSGRERGTGIPFEERWQSARPGKENLSTGRSARIPIEERFRSSREEDRTLNPGRSVEIPIEERFRSSRDEDRTLNRGRSADIPLDERFQSSRDEDRTLNRGGSADIPLDERFQGSRGEDRTSNRGKSTEISYEERKTGRRTR